MLQPQCSTNGSRSELPVDDEPPSCSRHTSRACLVDVFGSKNVEALKSAASEAFWTLCPSVVRAIQNDPLSQQQEWVGRGRLE